ncbi:MAG TPA: IS21 family transposase [Terracidiphilus sp.]|jgi:transposase
MSNLLKVAMIDLILSLHRQGLSQRRIARELDLNRETVARYLSRASAESKPANAPPGSIAPEAEPKPANAPSGSVVSGDKTDRNLSPPNLTSDNTARHRGRTSDCERWRAIIQSKCDLGLSAQRIYQDLTTEHSFTGTYYSIRRFVRRLVPPREFPFRRLECGPGDEAQVDFGKGAPVVGPDGKRRKTHLFRIVLSHSRKAYSEVVHRQTTDDFLRCIENAFRHFGGAPRRLVLDNLRAAVTKADWFDPELNPKVRSFGEHYGVVFLPTRPYTPRHKGKVENGVGYAQDNALKGRVFASLPGQNSFLLEWELTVADTRIHGTTRRQVGKHFTDAERGALLRLPLEPFPSFHEERRTVHRDGHIEVKRSYYAVPPEYLGRVVWARWDGRMVRIFNERMQQIATHTRREPGGFSTPPEFIAAEKISAVERGAAWLLGKVATRLGPRSAAWAEAMVKARGIEGTRVLVGLLSLSGRHSTSAIEQACETALGYAAFRLRTIRALVKRQAPKQEVMPFLSVHPVIRPLSEYGQFAHDAFQFRNTHQ